MIAENSDIVALTAQADIDRCFQKIVEPALAEFAPTEDFIGGVAPDMDTFLDRAQAHTHNAICYEMRRTFALIVGALFERQLRFWLAGKLPAETKKIEAARGWRNLIELVDKVDRSIGTDRSITDIENLWSVANAVRHGNGDSATKLLEQAPGLWKHMQTAADLKWQSDIVGNMRISDAQLRQYARATMRFWHLARASSLV
jgi:hypothetical protein